MANEGSECHCPHSKHNADSASFSNIQVSLRHMREGRRMEAVNIPPNVTGKANPLGKLSLLYTSIKENIYAREHTSPVLVVGCLPSCLRTGAVPFLCRTSVALRTVIRTWIEFWARILRRIEQSLE
ncbi:hypothetical protein CEXT_102301 [Caerostris extrusa]|uniref:Uncharacterized protein n=1 Tax=Caerostris extrusa TaxID=172846 RepID=A0AAV4N6U0_CAEEX|nr:hypothetical protein CEXT_102301 [Caerostris extrusa]